MPDVSRDSSARARLRSHSLRLQAEVHPYYLHRPRGKTEPAPGWYWQPAGSAFPVYLAYNSHDAEYELRKRLDAPRAPAGAPDELVTA